MLEATGGYEAAGALALQAAGRPVLVVNPRQAALRQSQGILAKTDRVDCPLLAQFAATTTLAPLPAHRRLARALAALLADVGNW